jgi:coenzyme F420-dependent glucose-6-phosphate dehydrogenase
MAITDALGDDSFELGYWLSSEEHAPRDLVRHAELAEASGFATAMISDHLVPWVPQQAQSGFVWSVLGAIATATRELRVGTGVSAPIHRMHPLVLAHAAATIETLMPGRFFLGLGTGERLNESAMGQHWPRPAERRSMLREAIEIIRSLWSGDVVTRTGDHFTLERAQLFSLPAVPPPIVLAASGAGVARLAGEAGDGLLSATADPSLVDAFEAAGGRGRPRMLQLHVCWARDDDEAREAVRRWWPNGGVPGSLLAELARPSDFEDLAARLDDVPIQEAVVSGPDPKGYLAAIDRAVGAGYRTIYLHQVGPDQEGFFEFYRSELRPAFCR